MEAVNNLAKRIKRVAFGITNWTRWRIRILLYAGPPRLDQAGHHCPGSPVNFRRTSNAKSRKTHPSGRPTKAAEGIRPPPNSGTDDLSNCCRGDRTKPESPVINRALTARIVDV